MELARNGWISVYDSERPENGEEVLTLSYDGEFPAPADMFEDPRHRSYRILRYFHEGTHDPFASLFYEIVFRKEGFYEKHDDPLIHSAIWRYRGTIADFKRGIVCWKHLDYPMSD